MTDPSAPGLTPEQRYWWRIALELKLRKCSGDAFQEFFSVVMAKVHHSDFVRVRPYGSLGDGGCDGYLQSSGRIYQCYGAVNGSTDKVASLTGKMATDYAKAAAGVPSIMKEWHMVHNLMGVPTNAITTLHGLQLANPKIGFGFIGPDAFEDMILSLSHADIEDLLGPAASAKDAEDMQGAVLRDLVKGLSIAASVAGFDPSDIKPVPANKLELNDLANHWRMLISGGWQNAHIVADYFANHPDPLIGETVATLFRGKYLYLKSQGLQPDVIMGDLYEMVVGPITVSPSTQVAAQALLAYLFESCDIFEDHAVAVLV